jgi:hypothetical protein
MCSRCEDLSAFLNESTFYANISLNGRPPSQAIEMHWQLSLPNRLRLNVSDVAGYGPFVADNGNLPGRRLELGSLLSCFV